MTLRYDDKDELCHEPGDDPWWQESVAYTAWDERAGLGLFVRIGHEVGQGTSTVWIGAVTDAGERFRFYRGALALRDADRNGDGLCAGEDDGPPAGAAVLEDGVLRYKLRRPEFEADLALSDFYPMVNPLLLGPDASLVKDFARQHWETSGRSVGTVRLGDRRYDFDGLHHRDHSWGTRLWDSIRTHRWVAGTTGPELSFMGLSWLSGDGALVTEGFVNRNGETATARQVDILTHVEIDGLSCRGGRMRMELEDGSTVVIDAAGIDGILSLHRNVACVDTICRVRTDSGRTGFCDFETTHNSRNGADPVPTMSGAVVRDGLSQR